MFKIIKNIEHERVITAVDKESSFTPKFFILLIFSTIIATLGLIADNVAVVIGAMIIAPLMWPILGVSLAITRAKHKFFRESLTLLIISIVLSIFVAWAVSLLSPILEINGEILARTNPNIIDLVIALATGAIATYIVLSPQQDSLAGVAVAAALIPPLAAAGISIALTDFTAFKGALLLFGANLFAIILMSILILALGGLVKLRTEEDKFNITMGVIISSAMMVIIAIPLAFVLRDSIDINKQEARIYKQLQSEIKIIHPEALLNKLVITGLERDSNFTNIKASIQAPVGATLYTQDQNHMTQQISKLINKSVDLDITISPILKAQVYQEPPPEIDPLQLIIESALGKTIPHAEINTYKLNLNTDIPTLQLTLEVPQTTEISAEQKIALKQEIEKLYKKPITLKIKVFTFN